MSPSDGFVGLPPHGRGQRIGLFGGSFNPPHAGHRTASLIALRRLRLDGVWWLISPGNPLKNTSALPSIEERAAAARRVAAHPRIKISTFEQRLGSSYTFDVVAALKTRCPTVRFVWLMGADSFADLSRWKHWRRIIDAMPLAVIDRPGFTLSVGQTRAATAFDRWRVREQDAGIMPAEQPPAWIYLHGQRSPLSSTALRMEATQERSALQA